MIKLSGEIGEAAVATEEPVTESEAEQANEEDQVVVENTEETDGEIDAEFEAIEEDPVAHHKQKVADATTEVGESALSWSKLQEDTKAAKKRLDAAVADLRRIVSRGPEEMPLFDKPAETPAPEYAPPLEWQERAVTELAITDKQIEKLGVETIGDLEDLRREISLGKKKWPKGIGPAAITKIEDAALDWLKDNAPKPTE